jgi:hypothetical protein
MSTNCLVTKLKESVDNAWLPVFGKLRCRYNGDARNDSYITFYSSVGWSIPVTLYGDNTAAYASTTHQNETYNQAYGPTGGRVKMGGTHDGGYIDIDISSISIREKLWLTLIFIEVEVDFSTYIKLLPTAIYHGIISPGVKFKKELKLSEYINEVNSHAGAKDTITSINAYRANVIADIDDAKYLEFANWISLDTLAINYTHDISLDHQLAAGMVANGRTSGTLYVYPTVGDRKITFDPSVEGGYSIGNV